MPRRIAIFIALILLATSTLARAQEDYQVLKVFYSGEWGPLGGLVRATDGNFYGTTLDGIYRFTPEGVYTLISRFVYPFLYYGGEPFQASDGHFYVVSQNELRRVTLSGESTVLHTLSGAIFTSGVVEVGGHLYVTTRGNELLRISADGELTVWHTLSDASFAGSMVKGSDGNLYGFTRNNGFGDQDGTLFRLSTSGVFTTVRTVTAAEKLYDARFIVGRDGEFYGSTPFGGAGDGTLIRMTLDGTLTALHVFARGTDGSGPGLLLEASDGNFYGTTLLGGGHDGGTLFRLRPDGSFTTLYSFSNVIPGGDYVIPWGRPLMQGSDGHLYGGGEYGIFRMTLGGEFRLLHSVATTYPFPGSAGTYRYGMELNPPLLEGPGGYLYGAMRAAAPGGAGGLFRLNLQRSACANALDLLWQDYDGGRIILRGALKSETPAFMAAFLVSSQGTVPLWLSLTPAVTPTFTFEIISPLASMGQVGVYTLVVTSDSRVCTDWTTVDTGGVGLSTDDLNGMIRSSELLRNLGSMVR